MAETYEDLLARINNCEEPEEVFENFSIKWFLSSIKNVSSRDKTRVCIDLAHYMPTEKVVGAEGEILRFDGKTNEAKEINQVFLEKLRRHSKDRL